MKCRGEKKEEEEKRFLLHCSPSQKQKQKKTTLLSLFFLSRGIYMKQNRESEWRQNALLDWKTVIGGNFSYWLPNAK